MRSTGADPRRLAASVRTTIAETVPGAAIYNLATGDEIVRASYGDRHAWALLLSLFAVLVVTLGAVGLCAVVARWVAGREREIGIRMALGARPVGVVRLVLAQATAPTCAGVAAGIATALFATRFLESQLFGLSPGDPATFALSVLAVVTATAVVCFLPARRAANIDPAVTIRTDS